MTDHERLSGFARLAGEPTRARMIAALTGRRALATHLDLDVSGGGVSERR